MTTAVDGNLPSLGGSPPNSKDGLPLPPQGIILLTRHLAPWLNSQNYDQVTTSMECHPQTKDGHIPEVCILQTKNLALKLNSQNYDQVTTAMYGHLPSLRWSSTNPRMVTCPPEWSILQTQNLALKLNSQNKNKVTIAKYGHLPSLGWSSTNPRMVTLRKEVYYRLRIWHLDLPYKTKTRWQLPWMATYHL